MEESVKRYLIESFRWKYHHGSKKEKGAILDEICAKLDCHRKHAVRLFQTRNPGRKPAPKKRGRKSKYDYPEFLGALHRVRKVMEFRNAKVMKANMQEWLPYIENHYGIFEEQVREHLLAISAATIDRYLKRAREKAGKGLSTTRPSMILRNEVPILTESEWDETVPGKMAVDTVAHCGNTTAGQYVFSLDMVDPTTHWTAQRAVWGKGATGVLDQTKAIEEKLPFPLRGLHIDNGSEFLNWHYIRHFTGGPSRQGFHFTRSRAHQKNDNCYAEQKNWSVVRRYFGYDRFDFEELVPLMNDLYENELYLYLNHFCRTFKLCEKIAIKSRYKRIYGEPQAPYERVIASVHVSKASKEWLIEEHNSLDPVALKLKIEQKLKKMFNLYKNLLTARQKTSVA